MAGAGPLAPASAFNVEKKKSGGFPPFQFHAMLQSVRVFQPECCVFVVFNRMHVPFLLCRFFCGLRSDDSLHGMKLKPNDVAKMF